MHAQDNDGTPMQTMDLGSHDFADNLNDNHNFGVEDTQVLASQDLQNFLLSDPDKVKDAGADTKDPDTSEDKDVPEDKPTGKEAPKVKSTKQETIDEGKKALEGALFGDDEDDKDKHTDDDQEPAIDRTGLDDSETSDPDETEENKFTNLSKDLMKLGVFTKNAEDETEDNISVNTPEEFLERFTVEKKRGAINILDNFLSNYGEDYRKMFDAVFVNGVTPKDYLQNYSKIAAVGGLDMTQEENQVSVLKNYYKSLKWDDERIEKRLTKLRDYDDLEEEAKSFQEVLVQKEAESLAEIEKNKIEENNQAKVRAEATQASYHKILTEKLKTNEIDGIPLTQKDAQELFSYMIDKPYKLESGELLTAMDKDLLELNRPENHELKIKLGLLMKKKLDMSLVKKAAVSKTSGDLFNLTVKNSKAKTKEKKVGSFF